MNLEQLVSEVSNWDDNELRAAVAQLSGIIQERFRSPDPPSGASRDDVAAWLARKHLAIDPHLIEVYFLPTGSPNSEIRLLEVNEILPEMPMEQVSALDFGLDLAGLNFKLMVADVSSKQWEAIQNGCLALPPQWSLDGNLGFSRRASK